MTKPRLSIGLPVYNGDNYLAAALGGLLQQSFSDFELIICDNASTDRTAEICRVFAANDPRIRYLRNDHNIGAAANYNLALDQATGDYFKWAAHDDICLPGFLEATVALLEHEPDVVLCHSLCQGINERQQVLGQYELEQSFDAAAASERFWRVITVPHFCIIVFGVMRRDILLKTIRHGDWVGADRNLLAELSLHGKLKVVPELLFQRRQHEDASIHKFADEQERLAWFNPALSGRVSFPTWRRGLEYGKAIAGSPLPAAERLRCYARLLQWLGARHHTGPRNLKLLFAELRNLPAALAGRWRTAEMA